MKQSIKHKNIIQAIKRKFKRNYYSQKILEHKNKYKNMEYYEGVTGEPTNQGLLYLPNLQSTKTI